MKGAIITLDGIMAMLFLILTMTLVLSSMPALNTTIIASNYLKTMSMDVLTSLEISGRIGTSIGGNMRAIKEVLQATSSSLCMEIEIRDVASDRTVGIAKKSGCGEARFGYSITYRTVKADAKTYLITARSWLKVKD